MSLTTHGYNGIRGSLEDRFNGENFVQGSVIRHGSGQHTGLYHQGSGTYPAHQQEMFQQALSQPYADYVHYPQRPVQYNHQGHVQEPSSSEVVAITQPQVIGHLRYLQKQFLLDIFGLLASVNPLCVRRQTNRPDPVHIHYVYYVYATYNYLK